MLVIILSIIALLVIILSVIALRIIILPVIALRGIILSVIALRIIILTGELCYIIVIIMIIIVILAVGIILCAVILPCISQHDLVILLLHRCERHMFGFQLHRLHHKRSVSKPEYDIVTLLRALGGQTNPVIQIGKLICPLFLIIFFLQFLKDLDPLLETRLLRFQNAVAQRVDTVVFGRQLRKSFVVLDRCHYIV